VFNRLRAEKFNSKGLHFKECGQLIEAMEAFQEAAKIDPTWAVPFYNVGLMFKNDREWNKSLDYNNKATELDESDKASWWNMGIAATALGHWDEARRAWRGFGIDVPGGSGPIDLPCGFCPIRLNPTGEAEVVWAQRIDPARAVLASIPFSESGHRWNDVVLNDGAPTGSRLYNGQEVPVFDALELLEPSPFATYVSHVAISAVGNRLAMPAEVAAKFQGYAEDWSTSVRLLCRACSEGRPHEIHDQAAAPTDGIHTIAIAARNRGHAEKILGTWTSKTDGIQIQSLDGPLSGGSTASSGKS
jgi:hypothetical protein